jgi:5-methylcytosine-specific restriction protein A
MAHASRWFGRGTRQERGYGSVWDKLRLFILQRDGYLCQCPLCKGGELRLTPATHVDHILPKARGGTDDPSNLRAINVECHKRVSLEQRGYKDKPRIGADGYAIR